MTIGIKKLADCVNASITVANTGLEVLQLSSVIKDLDANNSFSVANTASLPAAADNKGRIIFVQDVCGYRISDGTTWSNDFTSTLGNFSVFSSGPNFCGSIGDNTIINRSSPVSVVGGFTDWQTISVWHGSAIGLRCDGSVWSWGYNTCGKLGDGTTINRSSPVSLTGGLTGWSQAVAGFRRGHGLRNGVIWSWGSTGALGINANPLTCVSSPVTIAGGITNWVGVYAGTNTTVGKRADGTLWAWGYNNIGRVGDGTTIARSSPVTVVGGFTDWSRISVGGSHTLGVRSNGTIWSWGQNAQCQLGDGTGQDRSSPVSVVGGFTDWCQVSAGADHSLGLRTNGTLWSWGSNNYGQLGNNNVFWQNSPVSVVGGVTNWCAIGAGTQTSFAIKTDGTLWSWGCNCGGQLGHNNLISRSSPVIVAGGLTGWRSVAADDNSQAGFSAIRAGKGF